LSISGGPSYCPLHEDEEKEEKKCMIGRGKEKELVEGGGFVRRGIKWGTQNSAASKK
jgi:hypothetical protein